MRKNLVIAICAGVLLSSCGTYTGEGAYAGGMVGSVLGSAIGGITGGWRGSDVGTIVGMASGAVVGAAIGSAADEKARSEVREHYDRVQQNKARGYNPYSSDRSGYYSPNGGGDDRLYDFGSSDYTGSYSAAQPTTSLPARSSVDDRVSGYGYNPEIEIVNARFVDDNQNGYLSSNETGKIIFEVMNRADYPLYDVQPTVVMATANRHIYISPNVHVERIAPHEGIRYTAMVKADNRLKDGSVTFCLSVLQGNRNISKITEFNIETRR